MQELNIYKEWIKLDKYDFRILIIILIMSNNKINLKCKISDFCNELNIKSSSTNRNKIKLSLYSLKEMNYIKLNINKTKYIISINNHIFNNENIIKIDKKWYEKIKNDNKNSWENKLKVLAYILSLEKNIPTTYNKISKFIKCSISTVQNSIKYICNTNFNGMVIKKEIIKEDYIDDNGKNFFLQKELFIQKVYHLNK